MKCPECLQEFSKMGTHWRYNPEHRPSISDELHEIITGVLLGDGSLSKYDNPTIQLINTNKKFVEWFDDSLGVLSTGVKEKSVSNEYDKTVYYCESVRHPELNEYSDWYTDDGKRLPQDIEFTPTIIWIWYQSDGSRQHNRMLIKSKNESGRFDWLCREIEEGIGIKPTGYPSSNQIAFSARQSQELESMIDTPISGFEYKFSK